MPIHDDVTAIVGNTPLVRLNRAQRRAPARPSRPSSSSTTRPPRSRTGSASPSSTPRRRSGELKPGGTIVEATSGNTGIALAMVGAARGYKVVLTMPETMSKERRALLRAFGAELILTPGPEGMKGAVSRAEEIGAKDGQRPGPAVRQRGQPGDPPARPPPRRSGRTPTARSTSSSPASAPAAPSPASGRCSRSASPASRSSPSSRPSPRSSTAASPGPHKIQGLGANFVPEILDRTIYDEVIDVNAETSVEWARRAAKEEGLLVGISSGAALAAAVQVARAPGERRQD